MMTRKITVKPNEQTVATNLFKLPGAVGFLEFTVTDLQQSWSEKIHSLEPIKFQAHGRLWEFQGINDANNARVQVSMSYKTGEGHMKFL